MERSAEEQHELRIFSAFGCCRQTPSEAQSTRRVHGVLRHVLANGSASFQSHPNHANTFGPNPADRAIPHTKDL